MEDEILIAQANPSDAQRMLDLILSAFAEYRGKLDPESSAFGETADSVRQALATGEGLAAWNDGRMVGCLILEPRGAAGLYLGRLAVDPAYRGRGIAGGLAQAAEAWARRRGRFHLELNVRLALAGNIRLFERLGYRETARKSHPGFAHLTYLVMEKNLH